MNVTMFVVHNSRASYREAESVPLALRVKCDVIVDLRPQTFTNLDRYLVVP